MSLLLKKDFMALLTLASIAAPILKAKQQSEQTVVLILLGPPGAGKGTQATILCDTLQIPHISTGNLLRANVQQETPIGKQAEVFMDQGKLAPDNLILDMLFERVGLEDCQKGYILDGFPRTLAQAKAYHQRLSSSSKAIAINLHLPDDTIVERLSQRLVCSKCGAPFHIKHSPPAQEGLCDHCNGELYHRSDDKEEVIRNRLKIYHAQTAPLITYYSKEQDLQTICCSQPIQNVLEEILEYLKEIYDSIDKE